MKKEYDWIANKRNIPNLDLYTKLIGFYSLSMGINFFVMYICSKFIFPDEKGMAMPALAVSVVLLLNVPDVMTSIKKSDRDFSAVVLGGIAFGACSIAFAWMTRFVLLYVACIVELLVILFWIIQNQRRKKRKKRNNRNKRKQQSRNTQQNKTPGRERKRV